MASSELGSPFTSGAGSRAKAVVCPRRRAPYFETVTARPMPTLLWAPRRQRPDRRDGDECSKFARGTLDGGTGIDLQRCKLQCAFDVDLLGRPICGDAAGDQLVGIENFTGEVRGCAYRRSWGQHPVPWRGRTIPSSAAGCLHLIGGGGHATFVFRSVADIVHCCLVASDLVGGLRPGDPLASRTSIRTASSSAICVHLHRVQTASPVTKASCLFQIDAATSQDLCRRRRQRLTLVGGFHLTLFGLPTLTSATCWCSRISAAWTPSYLWWIARRGRSQFQFAKLSKTTRTRRARIGSACGSAMISIVVTTFSIMSFHLAGEVSWTLVREIGRMRFDPGALIEILKSRSSPTSPRTLHSSRATKYVSA